MLWTRGLQGLWRLENTALDGSGNGNHGTVSGAVYTDGRFGRCLDFDGTDDYLDVTGLSDASTSHTITFWAYSHDSATRGQYVFDSHTGRLLIAWVGDHEVKVAIYDGGWKVFGASPSANVWHFVAVVMNAATSKADMYLGGRPYGVQVTYSPVAIGGTVHIGSRYAILSGNWYPFNGLLDEFHVWNRALTQPQIQRVMMDMGPVG